MELGARLTEWLVCHAATGDHANRGEAPGIEALERPAGHEAQRPLSPLLTTVADVPAGADELTAITWLALDVIDK